MELQTPSEDASTEGKESARPASPEYYNYIDVFLADRYSRFQLLKPMSKEDAITYKRMQMVTRFMQEGCLIKAAVMGAGGGILGLFFGTFFFTMKPVDIDTTKPFRQQLKQSYSGFGTEVLKSVKQFAKIGSTFSIFECALAKYRAKQDIYTALYAGCATGAALSWRGGVPSMVTGCIGFGALSAAMEKWSPFAP